MHANKKLRTSGISGSASPMRRESDSKTSIEAVHKPKGSGGARKGDKKAKKTHVCVATTLASEPISVLHIIPSFVPAAVPQMQRDQLSAPQDHKKPHAPLPTASAIAAASNSIELGMVPHEGKEDERSAASNFFPQIVQALSQQNEEARKHGEVQFDVDGIIQQLSALPKMLATSERAFLDQFGDCQKRMDYLNTLQALGIEGLDIRIPLATAIQAIRGAAAMGQRAIPHDQVLFFGVENAGMDVYHAIRQKLKDTVAGLRFQLPRALRVDATANSLASKINNRHIPCLPGTSDTPLLLMEGLAPQLLDCDGNVVTVDNIRLIPDDEKSRLRMLLNDPRVLLGVSGGGKTQMLCEMLADEYGLFFVASRGGNGGCQDLDAAVQRVSGAIESKQRQQKQIGVYQFRLMRERENEQPVSSVLEDNLVLAKTHFLAVALARMLLLECLLEHYEEPARFSPGIWLWMQIYPDYMFQSLPVFIGFFHNLWKQCLQLPDEIFLMARCDEVTLNIRKLEEARRQLGFEVTASGWELPCFVDEAQVLLECCKHQFPSTTNPALRRSCFSAVVKSFTAVCKGPLMTGTSIRMAHAASEVVTAAGGKPNVDANLVQLVRKGHYDPNGCREYIDKYLSGIAGADVVTICQTLQGRPRFAERFVSHCIVYGDVNDVMTIFDEYVGFHVTGEPTIEPDEMAVASKVSIFYLIESCQERASAAIASAKMAAQEQKAEVAAEERAAASFIDLMMEFRSMALRHALTGQPQIVHDKPQLALIEYGLANVEQQKNKLAASISEPIATRAACYFFGLTRYQDFRLREQNQNASPLGNELKAYVALTLFNKIQPLVLERDAPVNIDHVEIPTDFQGRWRLWFPQAAIETGVIGCDSREEDDLEGFVGDNPRYAVMFLDQLAGPDSLHRAADADAEERRLMVSIQDRYCEEVDADHAIYRMSIRDMFTRADETEYKSRKCHRDAVLAAYDENPLPLLRVVVAYPAILKAPIVEVVSENEMILIIDGRNFAQVFGPEVSSLLDQLKPATRTKRRAQYQVDGAQQNPSAVAPRRRSSRVRQPVVRFGF